MIGQVIYGHFIKNIIIFYSIFLNHLERKKMKKHESLVNSDKKNLSLNEFDFEPKYVSYFFYNNIII